MAVVDGHKVQVGDYVCFKSDFEQCGKVTKINGNTLTLSAGDEGFGGDYIKGMSHVTVDARDCWIE
jgi:hypothetical protein